MRLDDRLTLRDRIEDLRDTVRDIIPYDILDEKSRQGDTDDRRDEIPPGMLAGYQMGLNNPLDKMNKRLQQVA